MYEHRNQPLLERGAFLLRLAKHALLAFGLIAGSLFIGMAGYHYFEGLARLDALVKRLHAAGRHGTG